MLDTDVKAGCFMKKVNRPFSKFGLRSKSAHTTRRNWCLMASYDHSVSVGDCVTCTCLGFGGAFSCFWSEPAPICLLQESVLTNYCPLDRESVRIHEDISCFSWVINACLLSSQEVSNDCCRLSRSIFPFSSTIRVKYTMNWRLELQWLDHLRNYCT